MVDPLRPVRPDPATRERLYSAFLAGVNCPRAEVQILNLRPVFDRWLNEVYPPPLPAEPPDQAICCGNDGDLWQRRDDWAGNSRHWFRGGNSFPYGAALDAGLDPTQRLYQLPDPGDEAAMDDVAHEAFRLSNGVFTPGRAVVAFVVRALAERGQT